MIGIEPSSNHHVPMIKILNHVNIILNQHPINIHIYIIIKTIITIIIPIMKKIIVNIVIK